MPSLDLDCKFYVKRDSNYAVHLREYEMSRKWFNERTLVTFSTATKTKMENRFYKDNGVNYTIVVTEVFTNLKAVFHEGLTADVGQSKLNWTFTIKHVQLLCAANHQYKLNISLFMFKLSPPGIESKHICLSRHSIVTLASFCKLSRHSTKVMAKWTCDE